MESAKQIGDFPLSESPKMKPQIHEKCSNATIPSACPYIQYFCLVFPSALQYVEALLLIVDADVTFRDRLQVIAFWLKWQTHQKSGEE